MQQKFFRIVCAIMLAAKIFLLINGIINVATAYSPKQEEQVETLTYSQSKKLGDTAKILTFNTAHAALGSESDYKKEGGKTPRASADIILKNARGIAEIINLSKADIVLLQDVDTDSYRSRYVDEASYYIDSGKFSHSAFSHSIKTKSTSLLPPYRKLSSGNMTLSKAEISGSKRVSLPSFKGELAEAKFKSNMLISQFPLENGKSLYVINFELGKYLSQEDAKEQFSALMSYAESLYSGGDYVLLGGSFHRQVEGTLERYPLSERNRYKPSVLSFDEVASGWKLTFDATVPTARILDAPFDNAAEEKQAFVSDGFILSPNLDVKLCVTVDQQFEYSAHNPVMLEIQFK